MTESIIAAMITGGLALIGTVAVFAGNLAGIGLGKWCDRIGYLCFFRQGTIAMLALTLLFAFFNSQLWIVAIFMFFVYIYLI